MNNIALDIAKEIRCLVCENQSIADSNTLFAKSLKSYIENAVSNGMNKAEIFEQLSQKYGDFILFTPLLSIHTIWLWVLPVFVFYVLFFLFFKKGTAVKQYTQRQQNVSWKIPKAMFFTIIIAVSFFLIVGLYKYLGTWSMRDYPLQQILYNTDIKSLLKQARIWREVDGYESPRIKKIMVQVLEKNTTNVEANWFMALYHMENNDTVTAKVYFRKAIKNSPDTATKKALNNEWRLLWDKK